MEKESKRVIKDGEVAVCYVPGYDSADWVYWEDDDLKETLMFHPAIVNMILNNEQHLIDKQWLIDNLGEKYGNVDTSAADRLEIEWVPQGSIVTINEYGGYVEIYDENTYFKA